MKEKIGEDGITLSETDKATEYNNYQVYLDLIGIGYSKSQALHSMSMSEEELKQLENQFGI